MAAFYPIGRDTYVFVIGRRLKKNHLEASYCRHRACIVLTSAAAGRKDASGEQMTHKHIR